MINSTEFQVLRSHDEKLHALLLQAASELKIKISPKQQQQLLLYLDKLLFWNKAYNLTAIKQPKEALIKHVIDCLSILPHLKSGRLLDIGTGAGLPGIIVAICEPERKVTVLDSNQKKIRFIRQLITELDIDNVTPIASRIENFNPDESDKFSVVTSRAFASLRDFVDVSAPKLVKGGYLQAMKGLAPDESETKTLQDSWLIKNIPLTVPFLDETRHLTELIRIS